MVVILTKGGGQLALDVASIDGIRYLRGYIALTEEVEENSSFETGSAKFHGTVNEDPKCSP